MHTDYYGGTFAGEDEANYLFSDDASTKDTVRYVHLCVYVPMKSNVLYIASYLRLPMFCNVSHEKSGTFQTCYHKYQSLHHVMHVLTN